MKKHLLIVALGTVLGVLIYYYLVASGSTTQEIPLFGDALLSGFCGIIVAYVIYFLTLKLDKLLPWKTQMANRLAVGILTYFLGAMLIITGLFYVYLRFILGALNFLASYQQALIKLAILLFVLAILYAIIYFALYSYYAYATLQIETVKQERKRIHLQLKALKSQLSPHFLFNSLNTISSLIFTDANKAELFIRRLAKIYQYTLNSYSVKLISLKEELELVKSYQYLLHTRFENKLKSKIEIPEEFGSTVIPPLALQMLVENAVKHNELKDDDPLNIEIKLEGSYICVENNLTGSPEKVTSFSIGLKNINARYLLLCNKGIIVSNGQRFAVKLPLIR